VDNNLDKRRTAILYLCNLDLPLLQGFNWVRVNRQFQIEKKRGSIKKGEYHKK